MEILDLKLFCDLVDVRSFTEAAKKNCLTQSAVSQRINRLNDYYGHKIFLNRKEFTLSWQGRYLYEKYKDILKIHEATEKVRETDEMRDLLSIGFSTNAKQKYFQPTFMESIYACNFLPEIYFGPSKTIFEKIVFGDLDYGVVGNMEQQVHDLVAHKLYTERIILVTHFKNKPIPKNIEKIPLLLDHRDSGLYLFLKKEMAKRGWDIDRMNVKGYIGTSEEKIELLIKTGFYGFIPESYLAGNKALRHEAIGLELHRQFHEVYLKKNRSKISTISRIIRNTNKPNRS